MTVPARLTIVSLGTRDQDAQVAFYRSLGLPITVSMPTFTCFLLGGVGLGLYPMDDLAGEAGAADAAPPADWRGVTLAMNVDTAAEVDPVWQAWVDAGATPMTEPEDRSWGGRSGYVADPEGNRWEIAWAPGATFDDDGAFAGF